MRIHANSYNENDSSNIRDYSNTPLDALNVNNMVITGDAAKPFRFFADFNGVDADYEILASGGNGLSFDDNFTIFLELKIVANTGTDVIWSRNDFGRLEYDGANLSWIIDDGVTTSTASLAVSTGSFIKVACTWDSLTGVAIFVDDTTNTAVDAATPTPVDTDNIFVGSLAGGSYAEVEVREIQLFDTTLSVAEGANEIEKIFSYDQGLQISQDEHSTNVGDILTNDQPVAPQIVVYAKVDADNFKFLPMNSNLVLDGNLLTRVGHRWDTTRQEFLKMTNNAEVHLFDGISDFVDLTDESKIVGILDKKGLRRRGNTTFITANITIEKKDMWVMADSSAGGFAVKLPPNPDDWEQHTIKDAAGQANAGGRLITVDGNGNTIDGAATMTIQNQFAFETVVFNTTEWSMI